jgi:hypothetical protein
MSIFPRRQRSALPGCSTGTTGFCCSWGRGAGVLGQRRQHSGQAPRRLTSWRDAATHLLSIDATEITAAELRGKTAYITLCLASQLLPATRYRDGNVIDGDADSIINVSDVWTFGCQ